MSEWTLDDPVVDDTLGHYWLLACAEEIFEHMEKQGFHEGTFNFGEAIALIHSELSEALEADRKDLVSDHCPSLSGVEEELADVFIRLLHLCARLDIDLGAATSVKMAYNRTREYKHGKKY